MRGLFVDAHQSSPSSHAYGWSNREMMMMFFTQVIGSRSTAALGILRIRTFPWAHGDQAQMVAHASLELSPSKRLGRPDTVSLQVPASVMHVSISLERAIGCDDARSM